MTDHERSPYGVAVLLESRQDRGDRHYDQINTSTLLHPNGTVITTGDVGFCGAAGRAILDLCEDAP